MLRSTARRTTGRGPPRQLISSTSTAQLYAESMP